MDAFLLWLGITLGGTVVTLVGIAVSEVREQKRLQSRVQPLQCPECGGGFDPASVARSSPPRMTPPPGTSIQALPPQVQATCAVCGLTAVFTEAGALQRTHREAPRAA